MNVSGMMRVSVEKSVCYGQHIATGVTDVSFGQRKVSLRQIAFALV